MTGDDIVEVWVADTGEQRRAVMRNRHDLFCLGGVNADGKPLEACPLMTRGKKPRMKPGMRPDDDHDSYDDFSVRVCGSINGRKVASGRLVLGSIKEQLPTGGLYDFAGNQLADIEDSTQPVEASVGRRLRSSEPSRLGLHHSIQGTRVGHDILLRMIGLMVERSMDHHFACFMMSLRKEMFDSVRWFPFKNLGQAFELPQKEGGPIQAGPMWYAELDLNQLAAYALETKPSAYRAMFPDGLDWVRPSELPTAEIKLNNQRNQAIVRDTWVGWKNGSIILPRLTSRKPANPFDTLRPTSD